MKKKDVKIFTFISLIFITLLVLGGVSAVTDDTQSTAITDNDNTLTDDVIATNDVGIEEQQITKEDNNLKKSYGEVRYSASNYQEIKDNFNSITNYGDVTDDHIMDLTNGITYTIDEPIVWGQSTSDVKEVTILGNGATINGDNAFQFITVNEGFTLTLKNMIITNTYTDSNGGAIVNKGTVNVENVTFLNNIAGKKGGAIYSTGTVNVEGNSHFIGNHINNGVNGDGGAAIYTNSALYIKDTEFDQNIAEYTDDSSASNGANGGAISVIGSTSDFIVESSTFTNNKGRHGGAIIIDDNQGRNQGTKKINNTVFKANQAIYGGAIETFNDLIIENSTFEENSVKGVGSGNRNPVGGAICVNNLVNAGTAGSLSLKNVTFTKNTAPEANTTGSLQGYGGAIYNSGPTGTIDNCTFTENSAYNGGAYYANTNKTECMDVTISNSNFVENTAHDGAAIWDKHYQSSTTPSSMTIDDCQFTDNVATYSYGSTIKGDYSNLVITDTNISDSNKYAINLHMSEKAKSVDNVTINGLSNINGLQTQIPTVSVTDYEELVQVSKVINNNYSGSSSVTISLDGTDYTETEPIVFENNTCTVTIKGNGKTMDANGMQFLTVAEGKTLTLSNLTIANARAANGSAVMNYGTLTVNNAKFENNVATENGGAIYVMRSTNAKLTVSKTSFIDNNAINGGALFTSIGSTVSLSDTNFTSNNATYGGAIHTYNHTLSLTRVNFNENNATYGGAICAYNTTQTTIRNTTFTANTADKQGGAIWNNGGSVLTANNTNFTNNKAGESGGAIWNKNSNITTNITSFVNNEAGMGGAIHNMLGVAVINQSTFNTNKATSVIGQGGAIWTDDEISISKSEFTENTAVLKGGAIYTEFTSRSFDPTFTGYNINITESKFDSNTAEDKGGAIYTSYITNITDSNFTANKAAKGGAVYITPDEFADFAGVDYADVTVNNVTFDANEALYYGGAIYSNGTLNVNDSTFTNNKMTTHQAAGRNDYGGGAICAFEELTVNNSVFTENLAAHNDVEPNGDGGVAGAIQVLNNSKDVTIVNSNFTKNSGRHGGAITINDNQHRDEGAVLIDNNNFVENDALYGAAIDTYHSATITNNNFTDNTISGQGSGDRTPMGAAIVLNNGGDPEYTVTLENNTFTGNKATDNGCAGAVFTMPDTVLTSTNDSFINNEAFDTGVIYNQGKATFTDDIFTGNTATYTGVFTQLGDELTVDNCTFENNDGNGYGDILYAFSDATITDSTFTTASDSQLVVMASESVLTATNNDVNDATVPNGLVYTEIDDLSISEVTLGEEILVVVRASSDDSIITKGSVELYVDDTLISGESTATAEGFNVAIINPVIGEQEITIKYTDDQGVYLSSQNTATLTVNKIETVIDAEAISNLSVVVKSDIITYVEVTAGEEVLTDGTLTITDENDTVITTSQEADEDGFKVTIPGTKVGTTTLKATYTPAEGSLYADATAEGSLKVVPIETAISEIDPITTPAITDFDVSVEVAGLDEYVEGSQVQVFIGETEIDSSRFVYGDDGYLITLNTDIVGTNTMTVKFISNNENYTDSEITTDITVEPIAANIIIDNDELTANVGDSLTLDVSVEYNDPATKVQRGTIHLVNGAIFIDNQELSAEADTVTLTIPTDQTGTQTYTITLTDDVFTAEPVTITVNVNKIPATINAEEEYFGIIGEDIPVDITVTFADEYVLEGELVFYDDANVEVKRVDLSEFEDITFNFDETGPHAYTVKYEGDKYTASDVVIYVIATPMPGEAFGEDVEAFIGDSITLVAWVIDDNAETVTTGKITFIDLDGTVLGTADIVDGYATLNYGTATEELDTEITIQYSGNSNYMIEDGYITLIISKKTAEITVNVDDTYIGIPVEATATVTSDGEVLTTGSLEILDANGDVITTANIEDGVATFTLTFDEDGVQSLTANLVDDVYTASEEFTIDVSKIPVTISMEDTTAGIDDTITITATLTSDISQVNGGSVLFTDANGKILALVDVTSGSASVDYTVTSAGTTTIYAQYIPSDEYSIEEDTASMTITASKVATTTTVDDITAVAGQTITLTARIVAEDNSIVDSGKVVFKINGKTVKDDDGKVIYINVENGIATLDYEVPTSWLTSNVSIQAVYSGSNKYINSKGNASEVSTTSGVASMEITSPATFTKGSTATFSVSVTDNGVAINTGKVVFKINGKTVKDASGKVVYANVVDGVASVEYDIPDTYKAKDYTLTAVYTSALYSRIDVNQTITIQ